MTSLSLCVDNRERHIIEALVRLGVPHTVSTLDIGDFEIREGDRLVALWERKTYADLAASIKDTRYKEQKYRLLASQASVIGYILEGRYPVGKVAGLSEGTIDSIIMGLTVRDKMALLYSVSIDHTAQILAKMLKKFPEYNLGEKERPGEGDEDGHQKAIVQQQISSNKKDNYTPELCYLAQLSQIPQVSYITAKAISVQYPSMTSLLELLAAPGGVARLSELRTTDRRLGVVAQTIATYMAPKEKEKEKEKARIKVSVVMKAKEPES